jgi:hypothetical protein
MDEKPVAPRFSLRLPIRYRPNGDQRWRQTNTVNVSASGALFIASEALQPGCKLEVEIWMNTEELNPSKVLAISEVVRQGSEAGRLMTAVRHLTYEVQRDSQQ